MTAHPWLAQLLLWVVPAMWSSNYLIARLAHGVILPHQLAFGRWALALLLMLPFVWRGLAQRGDAWRREWPQMLALGALGMWICGAWVYLGGQTTSATNMALIYAATPVAIAAAGVKLLHERMSLAQRFAVAAALAGVLFVIAKGDPANLLAVRFVRGDAWIVAAAVSWTAYSVLLKRWPSALGPAERLVAIIVGGLLMLLPFTVWEALMQPAPPLGGRALLLVALVAVLPGALSYAAYSFLQRELGASRTALLLYLAPVYGALGAWLVLGEVPGWYHAAGAALILPSIWLATRR
ncbi:MAG: DMT family transporter [Rhodoferax sp.]|uniref:DMT family transporter n=1 Tax=Rhodoferax sp. TaxID=50421 RepID=UPI002730C305|nr:DMT family transporter [Rhodoferax sp.]MDP1528659.1 DMT family transporter [Rhodoferax sp.]